MSLRSRSPRLLAATAAAALAVPVLALATGGPAVAAKSDGCVGGGYTLVNTTTGAAVAGPGTVRSVPAASFGTTIGVRGRYTFFDVRLADFAVLNQGFTGAANEEDITGGRRTVVFASKVPDHRGLSLSSAVTADTTEGSLELNRTGTGLTMKIQAKDCAQGGIFQMEVQRGDGTRTRVTHTLASGQATSPFYVDNPNFRARVGQYLGSGCTSVVTGPPGQFCVQVSTRTNIVNAVSEDLVLRDSAQVATRIAQSDCQTVTPVSPAVNHCGKVSVWDVASGGRMGFVTGEDATEVANPPTTCTSNCQAQNQVRGRLVDLGIPFPIPAGSKLTPNRSALALPPLTFP